MAAHAQALLNHLIQRTGIRNWTGCCSDRVLAGSAEYANEPAIALMLGRLPPGSFRLFSGRRSELAATGYPGSRWLQVHADPQLADLDELLDDLAQRHGARNCFGGITSGFESAIPQVAGELLKGGLSGVVFSDHANAHLGFTQGCAPIGAGHRVTRSDRHLIREIDDRPALDVLLDDLGMPSGLRRPRSGREIMASLPKERLQGGLLVELGESPAAPGEGAKAWVRNLLGIDTVDGCIAIAGQANEGSALRFCTRDAGSARADLIRMCTQIRESVEERGERLRGAVYVSCLARGENLFGRPGIETEWVQHYLGAPALVGFHANGEIHANRLHAYSAVLMAFS
jgi:small ligand-binding sensory domain FIST